MKLLIQLSNDDRSTALLLRSHGENLNEILANAVREELVNGHLTQVDINPEEKFALMEAYSSLRITSRNPFNPRDVRPPVVKDPIAQKLTPITAEIRQFLGSK